MTKDQSEINEINATLDFLSRIANSLERLSSPAAIFKPKVFPDGKLWCAIYNESLREGITGFGETPELAIDAFNAAFAKMKTMDAMYETLDNQVRF
jgi:hypothetical protein